MLKVKIKCIHENAVLPTYAHEGDSGVDLVSVEEVTLETGKPVLVKIGLIIEIDKGYEAQIRPRSGLALKEGITVLNTPGTIDSGYRGEVGVILIWNGFKNKDTKFLLAWSTGTYYESVEWLTIPKGTKIAQMVFQKVERAEFIISELSKTERNEGGFGSTGF